MNENQQPTLDDKLHKLTQIRSSIKDLQEQENSRKQLEGEERLNLDRMRAMMNKDTQEEKLEQNKDLSMLRACVSLAKTGAKKVKIEEN